MESSGEALGGDAYFPPPAAPREGRSPCRWCAARRRVGSYAIYSTLLIALNAARESVQITNPYFLLDDAMTKAVLERVRQGVRIEVLVPGTIDHAFVRQASRATWGPLLEAGVKIYEYQPALLHAKTMVIDGRWATIGQHEPRSPLLRAQSGDERLLLRPRGRSSAGRDLRG